MIVGLGEELPLEVLYAEEHAQDLFRRWDPSELRADAMAQREVV